MRRKERLGRLRSVTAAGEVEDGCGRVNIAIFW